jgi:glutaconyl-CoA/methylmalonyl-CoA decarboxylase subunit delta
MDSINIGLQLTVYGMGLVFLLLSVMAIAIGLLTRLDRAPAETVAEELALDFPAGLDADTVSAITIAVMTHRAVRRKQAAPAMRRHQPGTLPSRWVAIGRARQNAGWQSNRRS